MKKLALLILVFAFIISACSNGDSSGGKGSDDGDGPVKLQFFFPVAVGGPITKLIDQLAKDFERENENISVMPIYGGSYQDTMTKVATAVQGNNSPDMAVLLSTDLYTLLSMNAIEDLTPRFSQDYFSGFYEAFLGNTKSGDQVWSVPFQRSTIVLYYNKDKFREAGLDPDKAPATWEELREYAAKLTKTDGSQWGIEIPSTGYQYWMLQALSLQSGENIMSNDGKQVYFNKPHVEESLQFYMDLGQKDKVMPSGTIEWATVPSDFISGKTAMMFHTTGNLTKVKNEAAFDFGVAFLPANKQYGSPTGGGNLYVFKDIPERNKEAAVKFIEFLTQPERVAQWSIDTGYVGTTKASYETEALKQYVADFPEAAVARDQLEFADSELSTYQNGQVTKIFNDNIQAALLGTLSAKEALAKSQEQADGILKPFQSK
ncbi:ABC transporter substrate-binding protein [Paenibacillus sp. 1011MAR3C5]|uniref:ABC transporter substrate-binding protein n=1 Tax=Paenibacillus sp. 1011MAR3C5 TaxID=1675787 RepID=UPI000E6B90C1|nr:ABC transporter substrate-binding protein [Paenibacillus sp. 1011MAR3C5]RJE89979.1 ABC transporter substrate-binding protein [Paenibacillus sp. 1011MAR3C5]